MTTIIHLSIDDVWRTLERLFKDKPDSIFHISLFRFLWHYHKKYGASFTLYVVGKTSEFDLASCSDRYKKEFERNADWLKFGLHCVTLATDADKVFGGYIDYYSALVKVVGEKSISDILRLHGFQCEDEMIKILKSIGVEVLLCADDNRISYGMSKENDQLLREQGHIQENGINFIPTNIRLEKGYTIKETVEANKFPFISTFTHEYFFYGKRFLQGRWMVHRFLIACKKVGAKFQI